MTSTQTEFTVRVRTFDASGQPVDGTCTFSSAPKIEAKFEVGKTYTCRSACDHDCIFEFAIVGRTDRTVTVQDRHGSKPRRRKIDLIDGVEYIYPCGKYSMCPVLRAS